jgi:hypothetical protein
VMLSPTMPCISTSHGPTSLGVSTSREFTANAAVKFSDGRSMRNPSTRGKVISSSARSGRAWTWVAIFGSVGRASAKDRWTPEGRCQQAHPRNRRRRGQGRSDAARIHARGARDESVAPERRDRMAAAAAPYIHPRLSSTQINATVERDVAELTRDELLALIVSARAAAEDEATEQPSQAASTASV